MNMLNYRYANNFVRTVFQLGNSFQGAGVINDEQEKFTDGVGSDYGLFVGRCAFQQRRNQSCAE